MRKRIKEYKDHVVYFKPTLDSMDSKDGKTYGEIWASSGYMIMKDIPEELAFEFVKNYNSMVELLTRNKRK